MTITAFLDTNFLASGLSSDRLSPSHTPRRHLPSQVDLNFRLAIFTSTTHSQLISASSRKMGDILTQTISGLRIALVFSGILIAFIALAISLYHVGAKLGAPLIRPVVPLLRRLGDDGLDEDRPKATAAIEQRKKDEIGARRVGAVLLFVICLVTFNVETATRQISFHKDYSVPSWLAICALKGCSEGVATMVVLRGALLAMNLVRR